MSVDTIEKLIREAMEWLFKRTDFSQLLKKKETKIDLEEETCTQKN